MIDYSEMSDYEINLGVAVLQGFHPDSCDIAKIGSSLVGVEWDDNTGYATKVFDYCNNPADAWPIIYGNGISIGIYGYGEWGAGTVNHKHIDGVNPLRAAMIVFLKMNEK